MQDLDFYDLLPKEIRTHIANSPIVWDAQDIYRTYKGGLTIEMIIKEMKQGEREWSHVQNLELEKGFK